MKTVYFVTYGGGHVAIVDLIANRLAREPNISFKILALTAAYKQIVDRYPAGTVKRMSDYLFLFDDSLDDILNYGRMLADREHNPTGGISKIESLAYLGMSFADLVHEVGEAGAHTEYTARHRQAFLPVRTMKRILEHEQADVVLATTAPRCEQAALRAGNELGLPTVEVLDLFGELYPLPEAKHIVTTDEDSAASLRRQGLTDRHYYPFGQPVLDETTSRVAGVDVAACKTRLGLAPQQRILLVAAGQPCVFRSDFSIEKTLPYEAVCEPLFGILHRISTQRAVTIILRRHPNESADAYMPWLKRYPEIRYGNDLLNLYESLAVADTVLTHSSTVGVQAMACGRTVFTYRHHLDNVYPLPRAMRPPFVFSNGFEELEAKMIDVLAVKRDLFQTPFAKSNATEKIVELLISLAEITKENSNR